MFKYQVDKEKYVKFLIPIHKKKLFDIGLPVERSIKFFRYGKAIIWPKVGEGDRGEERPFVATKKRGGEAGKNAVSLFVDARKKKILVLLAALVEGFSVSHVRAFLKIVWL